MDLSGFRWILMDLNGFTWIFWWIWGGFGVDFNWIYMDLAGFRWIWVDLNKFKWILVDLEWMLGGFDLLLSQFFFQKLSKLGRPI